MNLAKEIEKRAISDIKIKIKKKPYCFYLNEFELLELEKICKEKNKSKSSVLREFIGSYSHIKLLNEIETYNKINKDLISEIKKCGVNLNQIAYKLHLDINEEEAYEKIEKIFYQFQKLINQQEKNTHEIIYDLKKLQMIKLNDIKYEAVKDLLIKADERIKNKNQGKDNE